MDTIASGRGVQVRTVGQCWLGPVRLIRWGQDIWAEGDGRTEDTKQYQATSSAAVSLQYRNRGTKHLRLTQVLTLRSPGYKSIAGLMYVPQKLTGSISLYPIPVSFLILPISNRPLKAF
jgi:hypothetical protein